jgi:hypothetical protein
LVRIAVERAKPIEPLAPKRERRKEGSCGRRDRPCAITTSSPRFGWWRYQVIFMTIVRQDGGGWPLQPPMER